MSLPNHTLETPEFVRKVLRGLRKPRLSASEVEDIALQSGEPSGLCVACEDGMFVVKLMPNANRLELFVLAAVAFRFGAVERQDAALLTVARDLGAKTVAFKSMRRGWGRSLGPEWTRRGSDEFVRDA